MTQDKFIKQMSFEDALAELEKIVKKNDTGETTLENAVNDFERGMLLQKHCNSKLKDAKLKIEKIINDNDKISTSEVSIQ